MPAIIQSGQEVWTYGDAVEAVLDAYDIERTPLAERRARAAVLRSYRDLPGRHAFSYLTRRRLLQTVASYSTGTVAFDFTGGTYERQLTLTTGTWPSWAGYGRVVIGDVHYDIDERKSSSIVTLTSQSNPGEDVASTTYTLYRSSYPLPVDFKEFVANGLWERSQEYPIRIYEPGIHNQALQSLLGDPSTPEHATIRSTGKYLGGRELVFGPPPNAALTYDMLYEARPRPLTIDDYSSITASVSGTAVTGAAGVVFPAGCVGSIIRFSGNSTKPTSLLGGQGSGDNPYVHQAVIAERTSATALVLSEAAPSALSSVGYTISDPLDIDPNVMLSAFLLMCEAEYARLQGRNDFPAKLGLARQAILEAIESDRSVGGGRGVLSYDEFTRTTVTTE